MAKGKAKRGKKRTVGYKCVRSYWFGFPSAHKKVGTKAGGVGHRCWGGKKGKFVKQSLCPRCPAVSKRGGSVVKPAVMSKKAKKSLKSYRSK